MDKAFPVEKVISDWSDFFPNYRLTATDLTKPQVVMGALFQVLDFMGIDHDVIIAPPPQESCSENITYYWDLLPVINMIRVLKYIICSTPQMSNSIFIYITHLLQPTVPTTHSLLLLLLNMMFFKQKTLSDIAPFEEELFAKSDQVKILENKKNQLKGMLNEQAIEKAERAGRLKKIDREIKQYEEELKLEKQAHDKDKEELEVVSKENQHLEIALEKKRAQIDGLASELEKKRALRVHDADDIRAQAAQAARDVQHADEKLNALKATLMQKENSLKNLQSVKPNLDIANNLLYEIAKLSSSLRDYENKDLECKEEEQEELNAELTELEAQLAELNASRAEASKKHHESSTKRQQQVTLAQSQLREAEEKDRKCEDKYKKAVQKVAEIQESVEKYETDKAIGIEELSNILDSFTNELKSIDEIILKKIRESKEKIDEKLRKRNR